MNHTLTSSLRRRLRAVRHIRSETSDRGSVLPMALAFLTLGSLIVVALLVFAITLFRNRPPLEERSDSLEAVRSGMRMAITMQRSHGPDGCFPTTSGEFSDINDRDIDVQCTILADSNDAGGRYGLVSTSNVGNGLRLDASIAAGGVNAQVIGSVFVSGGSLGNETSAIEITNGDLVGSTEATAQSNAYRYATVDTEVAFDVSATPTCGALFGPAVLEEQFLPIEFDTTKGTINTETKSDHIEVEPTDPGTTIIAIIVSEPAGDVMLHREVFHGDSRHAVSSDTANPLVIAEVTVCYQTVPTTDPTFIPRDATFCGSPLVVPEQFTQTTPGINCQAGVPASWWDSAGWKPGPVADFVYPMLPQIPTYPRSTVPTRIGSTDCYVYYPGRYSGDITLNGDRDYYFASGVYFFDGEITISGDARVVGGEGQWSGCSFDADSAFLPGSPRYHEITGKGVTWLLGSQGMLGDGKITVDGGSLRLNNRVATNSTRASAGINVMTVNLATVPSGSGLDPVEIPANDRVLLPGCLASEVAASPACAEDIATYTITPVVGGDTLSYASSNLTHDDLVLDVTLNGDVRANNRVLMGGAVFTPNAGVSALRDAYSNGRYDFKVFGGITASIMNFDFVSNPGRVQIGRSAETVYQRVQLVTTTNYGGRTFRSVVELEVDNAQRYAINSWVLGSDPSSPTGPTPTTTTIPTGPTTTTIPTGPTTTTIPTGPTTTTIPTGPTTTTTTVPPTTTTTTTVPPTTTTTTTTLPPTGYDFCNSGNSDWSVYFGPGTWDSYHWANRTLSGTNDAYAPDVAVNSNFGNGENPLLGENNNFSILWRQDIDVATTCDIQIRAGGDDGYAVRLDGNWEIVEWRDQSFNQTTQTITLSPGINRIDFYFYERTGSAQALLEWRVAP